MHLATSASNRRQVDNRIAVYRWFFYLTLIQLVAYFGVPALALPSGYIYYIEMISALTLGPLVAVYLLLVNTVGLFVDRGRRRLYVTVLVLALLWLAWAAYSWVYIDRMDYILR